MPSEQRPVSALIECTALTMLLDLSIPRPDEAFFRSSDQRVVSICWLELCIHFNTLLVPSDRLLERPLPYVCPVPGAEAICAHFSGYSEASPVLHHIRRFLSAIGATFSRQLTRRVTHLVVGSLDEDSADPVGAVRGRIPRRWRKRENGKSRLYRCGPCAKKSTNWRDGRRTPRDVQARRISLTLRTR